MALAPLVKGRHPNPHHPSPDSEAERQADEKGEQENSAARQSRNFSSLGDFSGGRCCKGVGGGAGGGEGGRASVSPSVQSRELSGDAAGLPGIWRHSTDPCV